MNPTLSIVIPVYKVHATLDRCVSSIIGQEYTDWEMILVDDGSPDDCGTLCDEWARRDTRIRVIHKSNGGLSSARNAGIDLAEGTYITFVDSDDYVSAETYSHAMAFLSKHPMCDILEYPAVVYLCGPEEHMLTFSDSVCHIATAADLWLSKSLFSHAYSWNKIFRRATVADIRFPEGRIYEDVWFLTDMLLHSYTYATIPHGCYFYTYNPCGISRQVEYSNIRQLLENQLRSVRLLGIDLSAPASAPLYLSLLNRQITLFSCASNAQRLSGEAFIIPLYRLPFSVVRSATDFVKVMLLNITSSVHSLIRRR